MTAADTTGTRSRLPEREPDDTTSFDHLTKNGNVYQLAHHLDRPETTIVPGELYLAGEPGTPPGERVYLNLLVAFDADLKAYRDSNAYTIPGPGKPLDSVLEITPAATDDNDTGRKRLWHAGLGIPEYWRFDEKGNDHDAKLSGDRLVEGRYEPAAIEEPEDGVLRGHSEVPSLHVPQERGQLAWRDQTTGQPIVSLEAAERQIQGLQGELRRLRGE